MCSTSNLPPGAQLSIGNAVLEITSEAHNGCDKFAGRFGKEALKFTATRAGRYLQVGNPNGR